MQKLDRRHIAGIVDWPDSRAGRMRLAARMEWHNLAARTRHSIAKRGLDEHPLLQRRMPIHMKVLSREPLVVVVSIGGARRLATIRALARHMRARRAVFLAMPYWSVETPREAEILHGEARAFRRDFPEHALVFQCNTPGERTLLGERGEAAILCNHNILVPHETFRPLADVRQASRWRLQRQADAVPNAIS